MKLVVIYGPPGVGKLTVAKELSRVTGYRILHNHLAIDLIESIFDRSDPKFWELIDTYRLQLVDTAARERIPGLILTSVNIKGKDDQFIKSLQEAVAKHSGSAHFVRLSCDIPRIKERLADESRKRHGKLTDAKVFDEFVSRNQVFEPIGFVESLNVDTTDTSPENAAKRIKEHYRLGP